MRKLLVLLVVLFVTVFAFAEVLWVSTQFHPAAEQEFIKGTLLPGFESATGIKVRFLDLTYEQASTRILAEQEAGRVVIDLFADLQAGIDMLGAAGMLTDLSGYTFEDRTFIAALEQYGFNYGIKQFVPLMQATYVMMVNKQAFDHLPGDLTREDVESASPNWTYEALLKWAKNLSEATGRNLLGFPQGPNGLWHRFLHGHIYPSYTGAQVVNFNSDEAVEMWKYMIELNKYVNPASSAWSSMQEPLLRNEVWIAWDHTARLGEAPKIRPDDFVAVPSPTGPKGRGSITVLAGLAIPKNAPDLEEAVALIDYLTHPDVQVQIVEKVGFFPIVVEAADFIPEGPMRVIAAGVVSQSGAADAVAAFIPGLGPLGGEFSSMYRDAFTRIVIRGEDIRRVINEVGPEIMKLFEDQGAPLPLPDIGL
jgi:multiple sugar transport system substrate-binding protein